MKNLVFLIQLFWFQLALFYSTVSFSQSGLLTDNLIPPPSSLPVDPLGLPSNPPLGGVFKIPVVVHIIHDGGAENISDEQVVDGINYLNELFRGAYSGVDTEIEFFLANKDPNGNCTGGINRIQSTLTNALSPYTASNDLALKNLSRWPSDRYLNIWVVRCISGSSGSDCLLDPSSGYLLGYSYAPCFVSNYLTNPPTVSCVGVTPDYDGVVVVNECVGRTGTALPNLNGILAHEIGHWLNLQHIFVPIGVVLPPGNTWTHCHSDSEGLVQGDFVDDTPPQEVFFGGCVNNIGRNTCTLDNSLDIADNIMDYNYGCQLAFTPGQKERMHKCLMEIRTFIWSEPNLDCAGFSYGADYSIKVNTTWTPINLSNNGEITIGNSLTIEPGATLTVAPDVTLHFCPDAKLIIKPNAKLRLSGTLTGSCGQGWKGVEVWGNKALSQYPMNGIYAQGRFTGEEGALIENAITGVQLWGPDYDGSGGHISAFGMTFRNNHRGVRFAPYVNLWQGQSKNYFGSFSNCNFITDNDYILDNNLPFFAFIDMVEVNGVNVYGSSFINDRTITGNIAPNWGYGIYALDAGFNILPGCGGATFPCNSIIPNQFTKLGHGIYTRTTELIKNKPFVLQQSNFNDCFIGLFQNRVWGSTTIFNNFNLGKVPSSTFVPIGSIISSNNQEQIGSMISNQLIISFTMEENLFNKLTGPGNVTNTIGTACSFTFNHDTKIRRNTYSNLEYGNISYGINANGTFDSGLHYLCNTNSNVSHNDFLVLPGSTIRKKQGELVFTPQGLITASAGNKFSYYLGDDDMGSDFTESNNNLIQYHYNPSLQNHEPIDIIGNIAKPISLPNECASSFCRPPCKTPEEIIGLKVDFFNKKSSFLLAQTQFNMYHAPEKKELMSYYKEEMIKDAGLIVLHMMYDTVSFSQDSLRTWMKHMDTFGSDLWLLNDYVAYGLTTQANQIHSSILQKHSLTVFEQNSLLAYHEMLTFLSGKSKFQLSPENLIELRGYLSGANEYTKSIVENILSFYGEYYPPVYELSSGEERDMAQPNDQSYLQNKIIIVFPNPTTGDVTFKIDPAIKSNIASITIFDMKGKLVYKSVPNDPVESIVWQDNQTNSGVYFYSILLGNSKLLSGKVTVVK